jgi:hypothetical protein
MNKFETIITKIISTSSYDENLWKELKEVKSTYNVDILFNMDVIEFINKKTDCETYMTRITEFINYFNNGGVKKVEEEVIKNTEIKTEAKTDYDVLANRFPKIGEWDIEFLIPYPEEQLKVIESGNWLLVFEFEEGDEREYISFDKDKPNDDVEDYVNERIRDYLEEENLIDGDETCLRAIFRWGQDIGRGYCHNEEKVIIESEYHKSLIYKPVATEYLNKDK